MIAESAGVDMEEAFARLRGYARSHRRPLSEVAEEVVEGGIAVADLAPVEPA